MSWIGWVGKLGVSEGKREVESKKEAGREREREGESGDGDGELDRRARSASWE